MWIHYSLDIRDCRFIAAAWGDLSSERGMARTDSLTCIIAGVPVEMAVKGQVIGEDGKAGVRGRLVTKQGQLLANALLAGIADGIGQAFQQSASTQSISGFGLTSSVAPAQVGRAALGGGIANAGNALEQYYLKAADKLFPVIEVDGGRTVEVLITKGAVYQAPDTAKAQSALRRRSSVLTRRGGMKKNEYARWFGLGALAALLLGCQSVLSGVAPEVLQAQLAQRYPQTRFTAVRATPLSGLLEVQMGENVAYTDADGRYFLFGHLYDMQEQRDLSAVPAAPVAAYPAAALEQAIRFTQGSGERVLALFADPQCGYCRELEQSLQQLRDVRIDVFLTPLLGAESQRLAAAIWCAPDRAAAWRALMLDGQEPPEAACVTPLADNLALVAQLGVRGTPTLIAADGRVLVGAASPERIAAWLAGS